MVTYTYVAIEPSTGVPVGELPLYGVHMDKSFSAPGNFTGTFRLGSTLFNDELLINFSKPGRYGVAAWREGVPVWAGMIWSRTYASDAHTVQLTAQTFESVFAHVVMRLDFVNTGLEETTLWSNLISNLQSQNSGQYNLNLSVAHPGATGNLRPVDYLASEKRYYQEAVDQLAGYANGFGYTVSIVAGSNGAIGTKTLQLVRNDIALAPVSSLFFDYPGHVSTYWYSENAANGAVRYTGKAANLAPGASLSSVEVTNSTRTGEGYIPWDRADTINDVLSDTDLTNRTNKGASDFLMPIVTPTFHLGPLAEFSGWNDIGKKFSVHVGADDPRWPTNPNGITLAQALEGWSLTPEASGQEESINLQMRTVA